MSRPNLAPNGGKEYKNIQYTTKEGGYMPCGNKERFSRLMERLFLSKEALPEIGDNIPLNYYRPDGRQRLIHAPKLLPNLLLTGIMIEGKMRGAYRFRLLLTNENEWISCSFKEEDQIVFYHPLPPPVLQNEIIPVLDEVIFSEVMTTLDEKRAMALQALKNKQKIVEAMPTSYGVAA